MLAGLVHPRQGRIVVDDTVFFDSSKGINLPARSRRVGYVFQDYALFPHMTVWQNPALALHQREKPFPVIGSAFRAIFPARLTEEQQESIELILELLEITHLAGRRPSQISGGQKQRVAIAGVVAMEPKCIVLDEPTAMLDPNGRADVIRTAHELNQKKGVTIILITHYMEEVVGADKVIVMDKGKVVMQGTPREIFSQVGKLKEYRLDVPQVTILADLLRQSGLDIPLGVLTREELVGHILRIAQIDS